MAHVFCQVSLFREGEDLLCGGCAGMFGVLYPFGIPSHNYCTVLYCIMCMLRNELVSQWHTAVRRV
jgi:hypothetical protein